MFDELYNSFKNMDQEQIKKIVAVSIKRVYEYRDKLKKNEVLSYIEEMFLNKMGSVVDDYLKSIGSQADKLLVDLGLKFVAKKFANPVFISLDCPYCKVFCCHEVEFGVDSVIECTSCKNKFRIRKEKF